MAGGFRGWGMTPPSCKQDGADCNRPASESHAYFRGERPKQNWDSGGERILVDCPSMTSDVYEPLDLWRRELRDAHARNVAERFEALVAESGVDEAENRRLVARVRELERELANERRRLSTRTLLRLAV